MPQEPAPPHGKQPTISLFRLVYAPHGQSSLEWLSHQVPTYRKTTLVKNNLYGGIIFRNSR